MNYIDIDFEKVTGFNKLSEAAKELFKSVYKRHNSGQGTDYKKDWTPKKVKEHRTHIQVHFKNGEWLHYYPNGTWGQKGVVVLPESVSIQKVKEVIGEEAAMKLVDAFPSMQLYIPNKIPEFPDLDTRNQYIKNLYFSAGKSIDDIAAKVDLSVERVRKIICQR